MARTVPATRTTRKPGPPGWIWLGPPPRALASPGWVLLPLRAFLGFTFVFAGLQKLANPGFFDPGNPASIHSQLIAAERHSPLRPLLGHLLQVSGPLGVLIAIGEVAVGLGALLGLWTRLAALGGMAISLSLFLTVSFHSNPYYTGSDIVFLFAWTPLVLAGAGSALSLDAVIAAGIRHRMGAPPDTVVPVPFAVVRRVCGSYRDGRCAARDGDPCRPEPCPFLRVSGPVTRLQAPDEVDRRTFTARLAAAGGVAVGGALLGGVAAAAGRLVGGVKPSPRTASLSSPSAAPTTAPPTTASGGGGSGAGSTGGSGGAGAPAKPAGKAIGPASAVPVGGAARFRDPSSGDPAFVVQPAAGQFAAFDAVCPHAGCPVDYAGSEKLFVCPCHGSQFNGQTGAVEVGPAQSGLARISIKEGPDGQLYVT
ncbi:MAG TPA: Rieske 2Fe-2S domain-containing protein [Acidimicrobiales bacterium]|nr:Rieske 2Fe-2S domain-containing protein [Acidimicrobiales bacterium]